MEEMSALISTRNSLDVTCSALLVIFKEGGVKARSRLLVDLSLMVFSLDAVSVLEFSVLSVDGELLSALGVAGRLAAVL